MRKSQLEVANELLLQPWFLPRDVAYAINDMITPDYRNKMRYFFEDHGCMICRNETNYRSNGMCHSCFRKIQQKILASVRRHVAAKKGRRLDLQLFNQEKLAKKLLARYVPARPEVPRGLNVRMPGRSNPVYEALCTRFD